MILDKILFGDVTVMEFLKVLVIFSIIILIGKIIRIKLKKSLKEKISKDYLENATKSIFYATVLIAFLSVFPILGINLSGLLVAGGIFAIIIGFASQSIISNLISGIFLIFERPIKIGDNVEIDGISGSVEEIRLISTKVKTYDGIFVRMPNDKVFTTNIKNYVTNIARRFEYDIGIRYVDDADKAIDVIKKEIDKISFVLVNPAPKIFVDTLGDNSVNIKVKIWSPSLEWYDVKIKLLWKLKKALEENGIQIPFPQREVWFRNELKNIDVGLPDNI